MLNIEEKVGSKRLPHAKFSDSIKNTLLYSLLFYRRNPGRGYNDRPWESDFPRYRGKKIVTFYSLQSNDAQWVFCAFQIPYMGKGNCQVGGADVYSLFT